jgi:hypothetical protein
MTVWPSVPLTRRETLEGRLGWSRIASPCGVTWQLGQHCEEGAQLESSHGGVERALTRTGVATKAAHRDGRPEPFPQPEDTALRQGPAAGDGDLESTWRGSRELRLAR